MSIKTLPNEAICRICCSTSVNSHFIVADCTILRCANCGFYQLATKPSEKQLKEIYAGKYFAHSKYEFSFSSIRELARRKRLLIKCDLKDGAKILEIGCATGDFIAENINKWDFCGIDISQDAIDQALVAYPFLKGRVFASSIEDVSFEQEKFDAIVLWDVIEHLFDPLATLNHLSKFVKPHGLLALSTPNIGAPIARILGKKWAFMTPPEHMSFFNRNTMTILLKKSGFNLKCWKTSGKWTTLGFVMYKISRVYPGIFPSGFIQSLKKGILSRIPIYIPTRDIQYVVAVKGNKN